MSDFVDALREHNFNNWAEAMEYAADEIESLQGEVEQLREHERVLMRQRYELECERDACRRLLRDIIVRYNESDEASRTYDGSDTQRGIRVTSRWRDEVARAMGGDSE